MIEIEYKFPLSDQSSLIEKLESLSAVCTKPRTYELSVMYDNPERLMKTTNGRIRVRKSGSLVEFCYKKPISHNGIKQEIEHQVSVDDHDSLVEILTAMQFTLATSYERYRTEYELEGAKVSIDEYPFGQFLEIEGSESAILRVATMLDCDMETNRTESCDTLFRLWREERGLQFVPHMKFADYNL